MSLHPEWQLFTSENPGDGFDENQRNSLFLSSPAGQRLATGIVTADITTPSRDGHPIPLRVYRREGIEKPDAVVIFFHSGGFVGGSLETEDWTQVSCRIMALDCHVTVVSVEYRLSPEYLYPVPINDGWDAFQHVASNLQSFATVHTKPVKMVIAGTSSGGQLAAVVSQKAHTWLGLLENAAYSQHIQLRGVILRAPVTVRATDQQYIPPRFRDLHRSWSPECETSRVSMAEMEACHDTLGVPLEKRTSGDAYPLWGEFDGLPRTYMQICEVDVLRDDAGCYLKGLQDAGVEVKHSLYKDLPHIFWVYAPSLDVSKQAQADCVQGLKWLLQDSSATDVRV